MTTNNKKIKKSNFFKNGRCRDCKREVRFFYRNGTKTSQWCKKCQIRRKQEKRERKRNEITDDKLDNLWSAKVKELADYKCEYCGKTTYLNSHHIFSRSNRSVRWDIDNGCCLCSGHHTLISAFSAHKAPADFIEWIKDKRGEEWYNNLRRKANNTIHIDQIIKRKIYTRLLSTSK